MESISPRRRWDLVNTARSIQKLELRDHYASDAKLFAAWRAGELEAVEAFYAQLQSGFAADIADGLAFRRLRVVSEPLSDYQRMAVQYGASTVEAGEELRWLPRRLVSVVPMPGNEFSILDDNTVIFLVFNSDDECVETQLSRDADVVQFCRDAFHTLWSMAAPHDEFKVLSRTRSACRI